MMAEVKTKLNKGKRRSTANPTKARKTSSKPKTRVNKSRGEKAELDEVYEAIDLSGPDDNQVDGLEKLFTSVNRVVAKRADNIAKKLAQRAEEGNLPTAKFVVDLGSKKQLNRASANFLLEVANTLESDRN